MSQTKAQLISGSSAQNATFNDASVSSLNGGPLSGTRNRIINGDMRVDQRNNGAAQAITAGNNVYTVDRWFALSVGANVTGQRSTGATSNTFRYQLTGAASVSNISFVQRIEATNSADLAGKTITVSFDMANSLLTTVRCRVAYAGSTDTWSGSNTDFYDSNITISSSVTRYSFTVNVPTAATTGLQLLFSVGSQTSGTWTIGDVQLEPGTVATPLERRSYGLELALCQRYYENQQFGGFFGWSISSDFQYRSWSAPFAVAKRAVPTLAFVGGSITPSSPVASATTWGATQASLGSGTGYFVQTVNASAEL